MAVPDPPYPQVPPLVPGLSQWRLEWVQWLQKLTRAVNGQAALVLSGSGTPEANVTAPVGTLFLRTDGGASTTVYVKESGTGSTGWVAK